MNTNYFPAEQAVAIYIPFLMVAVYILFSDLYRNSSAKHGGTFTFMCFNIIMWLICEIAFFLVGNPTLRLLISNAQLALEVFSITALFLCTYWFFRTDYKVPSYVIKPLFIFPSMFALVALSPLLFMVLSLLDISSRGYLDNGMPVIDYAIPGWGLWRFVAYFYSSLMIVAAFLIALYNYFRRPKFNKLPSALIIGAIAFTIAGSIIAFPVINPTNINPVAISACIALILYNIAIMSHSYNFYARYARLQAFNFLKNLVLITEKDGQICDFNYSANKWFASIGIDLHKYTLDSLINKLVEHGATIASARGMSIGRDISYVQNNFPVVLNMQVFDMLDKSNSKQGSVVFFFDVTQNRELLEMLEKKAGVDPLSGLPNRMAYEGALPRFDSSYHLPLSVVVCDLNGLKITNDTLGHQYGDLLIQTASRLLESACQKPNFVARIGGDEFILLLSQTDEETAEERINHIKSTMAETSQTLPFNVLMAMGTATKNHEWESLEDIIALADTRMYEDKRIMKSGPLG